MAGRNLLPENYNHTTFRSTRSRVLGAPFQGLLLALSGVATADR